MAQVGIGGSNGTQGVAATLNNLNPLSVSYESVISAICSSRIFDHHSFRSQSVPNLVRDHTLYVAVEPAVTVADFIRRFASLARFSYVFCPSILIIPLARVPVCPLSSSRIPEPHESPVPPSLAQQK